MLLGAGEGRSLMRACPQPEDTSYMIKLKYGQTETLSLGAHKFIFGRTVLDLLYPEKKFVNVIT